MIPKDAPIICRSCGKETGLTWKSLQMYVIPHGGIKCLKCGEVFLDKPQVRLGAR